VSKIIIFSKIEKKPGGPPKELCGPLEQWFSTQIAPRPVFLEKKIPRPTLGNLVATWSEISYAK